MAGYLLHDKWQNAAAVLKKLDVNSISELTLGSLPES
jgi:hypothetical protein